MTAIRVPDFVLMRGVVYPGHEKAPFVASGLGIRGCLSYKPSEDLLQCHECGKWFESLAAHIKGGAHGISVRDYKTRHWLRQSTPLVNRRIQRSLAEKCRPASPATMAKIRGVGTSTPTGAVNGRTRSRYEQRNEKGTCHAQLVSKIDEVIRDCGTTPPAGEFAKRGIHLATLLDSFNVMGIPQLMESLGYRKHERAKRGPSAEQLLEALRDFYVKRQRLPKESEWSHGGLPPQSTFRKVFGSTAAAYQKAGLSLVAGGSQGFRKRVTDTEMLAALRGFYSLNKRCPLLKDFGTKALPINACTVRNRFGSVRLGLEAAGIEIDQAASRRWAHGRFAGSIDRESIKESLFLYCEEHDGTLPTVELIRAGILGASAQTVYKLFGTIRPEKLMKLAEGRVAA